MVDLLRGKNATNKVTLRYFEVNKGDTYDDLEVKI